MARFKAGFFGREPANASTGFDLRIVSSWLGPSQSQAAQGQRFVVGYAKQPTLERFLPGRVPDFDHLGKGILQRIGCQAEIERPKQTQSQ